jgi:RNA polymerase sigma-70 factor (ECF subfamily)
MMDGWTFEQVVATYGARLRARVARHNLGYGFDEDELLQECLIRIWRACRADREVESPGAYAEQLVASVCIDFLRRRARERGEPLEPDLAAAGPGPAALSEQAQDVDRVLDALAALEPRRRDATALLLAGHGCAEIAQRMAVSEAAARNLAYRGLDQLRRALGDVVAA